MNEVNPTRGAALDLRTPQRQSLWAIVFLSFRTLRLIGLIQLLLFIGFVIARLPSVLVFVGLIGVVGVGLFAVAGLRWWRFTFEIEGEELVVRRGVVQQQRLSIPLGRVQSVSLEQKLLHRIVSLVQISLETAGTETAEFVIDAVDQRTASALQQTIANYRRPTRVVAGGDEQPDTFPPRPEQTVVHHNPRRVMQIALTQTPFAGLVILAPLFALGDELRRFLPFDLPRFDEPQGARWLVWFVPLALAVGLATSLVLNLVRVLLTDWNLTVRSTAAGLRRDAGLLSTTSVATPVPRIQIVRIRQGVLERLWKLHTVHLETIGRTNISVPGCSAEQVKSLSHVALAGSVPGEHLAERVSPAEVVLRTRNTLILTALAAGVLWWLMSWWGFTPLLLVPYVWARTRRQVRLRRWAIETDTFGQFRAFVAWQREEVLVRKVNGVTVAQRLFERRRGLATVVLSTAGGDISVGMIPLEQAEWVRDTVLRSVETDRRAWM